MKYIKLTQGKRTKVDDTDYEWLNQWKWCYNRGYATRGIWDKSTRKLRGQPMARLIMGNPTDLQVDHINGNRLDNQRSNLRLVTPSQNSINRNVRSDNTSGQKGVRFRPQYNLWQARICINGKRVSLGHFKDKELAIEAYRKAAPKIHGEYIRPGTV